MTYLISPYQYENGHRCYCLHTDKKPTQKNIILEASKRETIQHYLSSLEGKAK